MNEQILNEPIGPNGVYGSVNVAFVNGILVSTVNLSPAGVLNMIAKKIGGPIPAEVAAFLEKSIGLN